MRCVVIFVNCGLDFKVSEHKYVTYSHVKLSVDNLGNERTDRDEIGARIYMSEAGKSYGEGEV